MGCKLGAEQRSHSHEPPKNLRNLHWAVQAQLLRRGGVRTAPPAPPNSIDGRAAQLRAQAKAEQEKR
eukprot:647836-Alexandrium_andersonii.AAC.1